jgi:hypothetical protein
MVSDKKILWEFPIGFCVKLSSNVTAILVGGLKCRGGWNLKQIYSSNTTEPISTKLCWNDPWVVSFQNYFWYFRPPTKMATTAELNLTGHPGWKSGSPDTNLEGGHPRIIPPKLGCNWPSGFWGEDFNQTLLKWFLGGLLPKLFLVFQTSNQDGHHSRT